MARRHGIPDAELRTILDGMGFEVPAIVVSSWSGAKRERIISWVRFARGDKKSHRHKMPECLLSFQRSKGSRL